MSIFDRIGRMARAEVSEMKRVLREAKDERRAGDALERVEQTLDGFEQDEARYHADVASAEAELAAEHDRLAAEIAYASRYGDPSAAPGASAWAAPDPGLARGADLWARAGAAPTPVSPTGPASTPPAPSPAPTPPGLTPGHVPAPGWVEPGPGWGAPAPSSSTPPAASPGWGAPPQAPPGPAPHRPGRTEVFPREVREAYAVLELPLGSDRGRIHEAHASLLARYHPDRHADHPQRHQTAIELSRKIGEARDLLVAWLEGRR